MQFIFSLPVISTIPHQVVLIFYITHFSPSAVFLDIHHRPQVGHYQHWFRCAIKHVLHWVDNCNKCFQLIYNCPFLGTSLHLNFKAAFKFYCLILRTGFCYSGANSDLPNYGWRQFYSWQLDFASLVSSVCACLWVGNSTVVIIVDLWPEKSILSSDLCYCLLTGEGE